MSRFLRIGASGPDVAELQQALNARRSLLAPLDPDGMFGPLTDRRRRKWELAPGPRPPCS
ncbi:MAG: hypothetical protein U0800_25850 [Isosphaeraceae bacterium]